METIEREKPFERLSVRSLHGDLHVHTFEGSEDASHQLEEIARYYKNIGLKYFAVTDHYSPDPFKNRKMVEELAKRYDIRILLGMEVDIDEQGEISARRDDFTHSELTIGSIHDNPDTDTTTRIIKAIQNPGVDIIGHPGRYTKESVIDWEAICKEALLSNKALEINLMMFHRIASGITIETKFQDTVETLSDDAILAIAKSGVLLSLGSDLHKNTGIDENITPGSNWRNLIDVVKILSNYGISKDRVINSWKIEDISSWASNHRN